MENGNYTVGLHFAEIICTDDNTYSSLGRLIFDIYIQGSLLEFVDLRLDKDHSKQHVETVISVALQCTNVSIAVRPAVSSVMSMLEGQAFVKNLDLNSSVLDDLKIESMRKHFQLISEENKT
ncbi:hypothetical protein JCGZ_25153 [Jatropha curcas]|uniref:non-specific serine/threonine protein kinase n=1 Tax=Jatropha curcas TaxID=180498 RepID=A0A067JLM2_JATCU|nr:hypothetical protein JCGZ_25153 [Jatropha curcas]